MRLVRKVKVRNLFGLHTRPAASIVKILQPRQSSVHFTYRGETVDARSIMSLLMLSLRRNAQLEISVEGVDAEETMHRLIEAFEQGFGEH